MYLPKLPGKGFESKCFVHNIESLIRGYVCQDKSGTCSLYPISWWLDEKVQEYYASHSLHYATRDFRQLMIGWFCWGGKIYRDASRRIGGHLPTTTHNFNIVRISISIPKMLARSLLRRQVAGLSKNASAGFSTSIVRSAGNLSIAQQQVCRV